MHRNKGVNRGVYEIFFFQFSTHVTHIHGSTSDPSRHVCGPPNALCALVPSCGQTAPSARRLVVHYEIAHDCPAPQYGCVLAPPGDPDVDASGESVSSSRFGSSVLDDDSFIKYRLHGCHCRLLDDPHDVRSSCLSSEEGTAHDALLRMAPDGGGFYSRRALR